jgi:hypothetical protein
MATSIYGSDLPGDFDEEQAAIERRKLQLINAMKNPIGGPGSRWAGGIANFLQNAIGTNLLGGEDVKSKDLARRRADYAEQAFTDMGKVDTPAQPGVMGSGPLAPPPGTPGVQPSVGSTPMNTPEPGPNAPPEAFSATQSAPPDTPAGWTMPGQEIGSAGMIPKGADFAANKAATPMIPGSMSEKLKLISRMAQGGPMYAKVAEKVLTQVMEAPEKEAARKAAQADRALELEKTRNAAAEQKDYQRNQQLYMQEIAHSQQVYMEAIRSGNKSDLAMALAAMKALHAGSANAGNLQLTGSLDNDGTPLAYDKRNNKLIRVGTDGEAPLGTPQSRSSAEKGAMSVREMDGAMERGGRALKMVTDFPNAFGGLASVGTSVASAFGPQAESTYKTKIYTPEEMTAQAYIGREGAQVLKDLYGAALTKGEAGRASPFEYKQGDSPEAIASKIKGLMEILQAKAEFQSPASKAMARPGQSSSGVIRTTPGASPTTLRSKYNLDGN